MNRTDRLLAIVLELRSQETGTRRDLAATFEVTKRTIYRDMLALDGSGVPIVAIPGHGYSLVGLLPAAADGKADEAIMLLLGSDFIGRNFDTVSGMPPNPPAENRGVREQRLGSRNYLENSIHFGAQRAVRTGNTPTASASHHPAADGALWLPFPSA